jgi:hypothetical protein
LNSDNYKYEFFFVYAKEHGEARGFEKKRMPFRRKTSLISLTTLPV